ncbi:MAG TPA: RNA polymerase sigma factor [Polyangia bacterium]
MDVDAFEAAHRRHAAAVFARCRRLLRDDESARDVTQEVFIRCLGHRNQLRSGRELLGWLYRVATNLCLNLLRDQASRRAHDARLAQSQPAWLERPCSHEVLELLDGLDERTQAIAIYVYVDGMTHEEAAEVAQVTDRTVRNRLVRFAEHARERAGVWPPNQSPNQSSNRSKGGKE